MVRFMDRCRVYELQRTIAPVKEVMTVAEAKAHLRVDHDDEDFLIDTYIRSARQWAESFMRRSLIEQTWTLTLNDFPVGDNPIRLPNGPIIGITSVSYYDVDNALQSIIDYQFTAGTGSGVGQVRPAAGDDWPDVYDDRSDAVQITYTAGYGDSRDEVPDEIRTAIMYRIGDLYENRAQADHLQTSRPLDNDFVAKMLDHMRAVSI